MTNVTEIHTCRDCGKTQRYPDDGLCVVCGALIVDPRFTKKRGSTFVVFGISGIPKLSGPDDGGPGPQE